MQQDSLFSSDSSQQVKMAGPVTCLGKTFANDQVRREYFLALLAEKLKAPEFRKIEGFPIGSDNDILNLSDPPYYTACPNPWIGDFVAEWEAQKPACEGGNHREPFAADVSEGKNDPIYNAHAYHTKVPTKVVMRYILHYTNPGDIIFDGFCGTGMTGLAAKMCGNKDMVLSLGYQVTADGSILKEEKKNNQSYWVKFSKLGERRAILNDLSPAATFISYNYNTNTNPSVFERKALDIIELVEQRYKWMYETLDVKTETLGKVNYTVWSDVFSCPHCQEEIIFLDAAVDASGAVTAQSFQCEKCGSTHNKSSVEKIIERVTSHNGTIVKRLKKVPVLINYTTSKGRYEKRFSQSDQLLLSKISQHPIPKLCSELTLDKNREQYKRDALHIRGIETISDFYTRRNLIILGALWNEAINSEHSSNTLKYWLTSIQWLVSNMYRHRVGGGGGQQGKLTIPSLIREQNVFNIAREKLKDVIKMLSLTEDYMGNNIISTSDTSTFQFLEHSSVDYIFIDPPFGGNIFYSDLNSIWESWLSVQTNDMNEAVVHKAQTQKAKKLSDYAKFMRQGLSVAYSVLKPGRWITIEFSNSQAAVWNVIQNSIQEAGFVVANVAALDKKQRSFRSVTSLTAVKQDLVISAYKPDENFEKRFITEAHSEDGVWDFIQTHLEYIPPVKVNDGALTYISERDPRILYDQLISYYVRKGYQVPIDSKEFQIGLSKRFSERDGMYFLPEQAAEYDKIKMSGNAVLQTSLFVSGEASAIDWLRQILKIKPQLFSDITPQFMQQLNGWSKNELMLDLRELLSQNFLCYDGQDEVPEQIHSYLSSNWKELRNLSKTDPALIAKAKDRWYVPDPNKSGDLEKLREKTLLKEFEEYKTAKKKLKVFRIEAIRIGFKKLWEQQEFATLIAIADKLPSNVLEEDPVLLMYYDQAVTLSQVDTDDEW